METGLFFQYVLIALVVALSAGYVALRQLPGPVRKLSIACAVPLLREGRAPWLCAVGRWITPPMQSSAGACATGCNRCGAAPSRR